MEEKIIKNSRAVLVTLCTDNSKQKEVETSLDELERLLDTAGGEAVARLIQNKDAPDVRTVIGSGKVEELKDLCEANEIKLVIFDIDLSPSQIRNLENELGDVSVIDRSMLILDIFALHATSGEGKLQVELAQLKYTAPRLMGKGSEMSRLGGGIGTRGPGETKLESDRRHLQRRITALENELEVLDKNRRTMRASRDKSGITKVAIVGYTNAGKSTLLNRLTDAGILAEDKLFATLDPTTRKYELPGGETVLLTDTVGFIRNLPHHLVKAFKSTLDEAVYADVLMILIDASDEEFPTQLEVTQKLLSELGAAEKPTIYVFNKCDRGIVCPPSAVINTDSDKHICISAQSGEGVDQLATLLEDIVHEGTSRATFFIPNSEQGALNKLYSDATIETIDYGAEGVTVVAIVDAKIRGMLRKYDTEPPKKDEED